MAAITLKSINKQYGSSVWAVRDFSLEIKDQEFIVLVGPSGCGKSTLLRMIAGLEDITGGELLIDGKIVNQVSPKDRDVAMVFQNYALYPHMTVYQNMAFGLKMHKMSKSAILERIQKTAKQLQIEDLLKRKPAALSGGQRQRVALGRAMVREPVVFLLDEPLSNLDAKLRTEMRLFISMLHKQLKTTFVYVTHDQVEAMTMADKIVVMKDGIIQQAGSPTEIYDQPANMFVASFMGTPKINLLPGKVILCTNKLVVEICGQCYNLSKERFCNEVLAQCPDEPVSVGIRPQAIRLQEAASDENLKATVTFVENLGAETIIHLECHGHQMVAEVYGPNPYKPGDVVGVDFLLEQIHLFDPKTEKSLRQL